MSFVDRIRSWGTRKARNDGFRSQRRLRTRRRSQEQLESRVLLAGDLIAKWLADDLNVGAGETIGSWVDSVGTVTGTSSGTPLLHRNALGGRSVVDFDAADGADLIRIDNSDNPLSGAGDFTVAVAFATTSVAQTDGANWFHHMGIVDSNSGGFATDWGISLTAAGQVSAGMGGGFGKPVSNIYSAEQGFNDGEPHIAIFTRAGGTMSLYVDNGSASSTNNASAASRATSVDLVFGNTQTGIGGTPFTGQLAEVRFYDGFVNESEAANLHDEMLAFYQNGAPQPVDDEYSTPEDAFLFVVPAATGVLANDFDPDSDELTAELVETVKHGNLSLKPDGSFVYSSNTNYFGTDTFTYRPSDFRQGAEATVSIHVTPVYDPASPVADSYKGLARKILTVDVANGVLANDRNPDLTELVAVLDSDVSDGSLTLNPDGSFEYDPQQFAGTTSFRYRIDDGTRVSAGDTVTLNINTPPVASGDLYQVTEDSELIISVADGVIANDADDENDPFVASLVSGPSRGTLEFREDGSFQYLPEANYFGTDSFTYRIADWIDSSDIALVELNVNGVDDRPLAQADVYFGAAGQGISKAASNGVLSNDSDIDSEHLIAELVNGPVNGNLVFEPDGSFTYTSDAQFVGTDSFSYRTSDANSRSDVVEVQLFVGTSPVQISEMLTANVSSLSTRIRTTVDDSFSGEQIREDWIELQNLTTSPLDLGGFHLTDDPNAARKWRIPAGVTIPASGHLTLFASRFNITDPALDELGMLHTNFTLRVEGEYVAITSPDGFVLDGHDPYPRQTPDVSFGTTDVGTDAFFVTPTPDQPNGNAYSGVISDPTFSVDRGFYTDPFLVMIESATPDVQIRYTTDGSAPTETTGQIYSGPINITTTTNLRAAAFKDANVPSRVTTHTYVFLADVINQGNSPAGYPDMFGLGPPDSPPWAPRPADYEMDPEITQSPKYRDLMDDALLAIPSISIVTSIENLFDRDIGIYQNTDNHGVEWERPASIEMILPDGSTAFQIDAGLRIQGGASREPWKNPKHGFRLKFKGIYGADDLRYDWFGGDAVDEFDEIVLRAGANQAWTHHNNFQGDNRGRAQYIRDQWANDTYRAMGNPAPHTDYAHVYVNGMYWGLYNPKERPTADFMASYFGGADFQYDVLNAGTVLDGNRDAWSELTSRDYRDLEEDAKYEEFSELLDIDAFIDYMIMNHYGGNLDWDSHNWYAVHQREPDGKFFFVPWDSEFFFVGPNDNKVRSREAAPGQLFRNLQSNEEFVMGLADRIQQHLFNDGLLTPDRVVERWEARSSQITDAIIGESARWGDFRRDVDRQGIAGPFELLERDVQWMAERERLLNDYFPVRTENVVEQYRRANLFPDTPAPLFNVRGGRISSTDPVELTTTVGTIYYTTDGGDPRLPGGALNPNAIEYAGPFQLAEPSMVRTRVLNDTEWSAIDEALFVVDAAVAGSANLRISEINYNPGEPSDAEIAAGFDDNDDFEFIELANISDQRIELTDVRFVKTELDGNTEGIDFAFADGTLLEPGHRLLVVEDAGAFAARYGEQPSVAGQWTGRLGNGGEQITLMAGQEIVQQFAYSDSWHPSTDGDGFTLESVDPAASDLNLWAKAEGWRASGRLNGSPGTTSQVVGDSNRDGRFDSSDLVLVFVAGEYEDDEPNNSTFEEGDWNGDGDFTSLDLVLAFQAGTYVDAAIMLLDRTSLFVESDETIKSNQKQRLERVLGEDIYELDESFKDF